ncbi:hypothetical protein TNCT_664571 [Trichonephila clavata]|uniref:Uncharacterized protein n=1 Tax=Trichonephila clavata TaxID=2740835 RepID=A0A8X6L879_TRICU|nr:hypothetical protein TNCT_664571 [Trichonephila clavata]
MNEASSGKIFGEIDFETRPMSLACDQLLKKVQTLLNSLRERNGVLEPFPVSYAKFLSGFFLFLEPKKSLLVPDLDCMVVGAMLPHPF